ncbi:MAG: excinuclease ABC subunit UvrC [Candidatus Dojkabacteria bacterium]
MNKDIKKTGINDLQTKIKLLPQRPGIYKFLDEDGKILYIGKATNLRSRVSSYFSSTLYDRPRIKQMIPYVKDVIITETNNEIESLVLESALIKKHKPFYNSDKKDDKSYVWIYISTKDKFPTVKIVRKISTKEMKRGRLFGPYPSSSATKRIFTYLRKLYPFCTCKKENSKECLYFHLGLCPGPYQGHISEEDYRKNINEIIKFLSGRKRGQIREMEKEMYEYSKEKNFEKAAALRDRISDLKYLGEKIDFLPDDTEQSYRERRKEVLKSEFENLKRELGLKELNRIECYDISNIQGELAYGSMVVAEDGEIRRDQYRIFKIEDIDKPNDPAMLKRVLERRFDTKNKMKYPSNPDIILIDGGKSQLSVLHKGLRGLLPSESTLTGISKGKRLKRSGSRQLDEFWLITDPSDKESKITRVDIVNKSILIDLRDEAHRFAILHHRKSRIRKAKNTELEKISGVGKKRMKRLLKDFGDIKALKKATTDEINKSIRNKTVSEEIYKYFHQKK